MRAALPLLVLALLVAAPAGLAEGEGPAPVDEVLAAVQGVLGSGNQTTPSVPIAPIERPINDTDPLTLLPERPDAPPMPVLPVGPAVEAPSGHVHEGEETPCRPWDAPPPSRDEAPVPLGATDPVVEALRADEPPPCPLPDDPGGIGSTPVPEEPPALPLLPSPWTLVGPVVNETLQHAPSIEPSVRPPSATPVQDADATPAATRALPPTPDDPTVWYAILGIAAVLLLSLLLFLFARAVHRAERVERPVGL